MVQVCQHQKDVSHLPLAVDKEFFLAKQDFEMSKKIRYKEFKLETSGNNCISIEGSYP